MKNQACRIDKKITKSPMYLCEAPIYPSSDENIDNDLTVDLAYPPKKNEFESENYKPGPASQGITK